MDKNLDFSGVLFALREDLGYRSARSFYEYLSSKARLEFNYAYYKRFENGEAIPSIRVVNSLIHLLPSDWGERIVLAYCATCFPNKKEIFHSRQPETAENPINAEKPRYQQVGTRLAQRILTEREILVISSNRMTYYLYLLMSLSHRPISTQRVHSYFKDTDFESSKQTLLDEKLIFEENGMLQASHPEYAFPNDEGSQTLQEAYGRLNQYDLGRDKFFALRNRLSSDTFRRIPKKYGDFLIAQMNVLLNLVRMAEDSNEELNTDVLSFSFKIHQGSFVVSSDSPEN